MLLRMLTASIGFLVLFVAATPAMGSAVVAQARGSAHWTIDESVFGVEVGNRTMSFTATRFTDGRVEGSFEYHQVVEGEAFRFTGRVTCLQVYDGNRAKFGGEIITSNDATVPVGTFGWFQVIDQGVGAGSSPDQSTIMGIGDAAANEAFCANPAGPRFIFDTQGSILVR